MANRSSAPENNQDAPTGTAHPVPGVRGTALRLSGRLLPLVGPARLYICGITPYDVTHLGHAATFVWSDVVASVLRMAGVEVVTCRNITDVDDVLSNAADLRGRAYDEFALYQEYLFEKDMAALRVHPPTHEPRARHHIRHVQQLAAALLATGHAYERAGHVYFRGGAGVTDRAGLDRDRALAMSAEFGDDPDSPDRDDPFDVPMWRPSTRGQPAWPSVWGSGRPGWHAECAAMALSMLGTSIDILCGGADLAFPHHAYQASMAETATAVSPFARAHLHVGAVYQDGHKMAKSTGNLTLVSGLLLNYAPAAIRLLILNRPWNRPWEYRAEELDATANVLEVLYSAAGRPNNAASAISAVTAALLDDLDVPRATAIAEESGGEAARLLLRVLSLA